LLVPSTNATDRPLSELMSVSTLSSVDLITHQLAQPITHNATKGNAIDTILILRHHVMIV
jgi:hypothetical protein